MQAFDRADLVHLKLAQTKLFVFDHRNQCDGIESFCLQWHSDPLRLGLVLPRSLSHKRRLQRCQRNLADIYRHIQGSLTDLAVI